MPNIAKGDGSKTEVVAVRFTKEERAKLEAIYGKASRGVRIIVTAALNQGDSK